jgi:peptidoglycan hydrolase-like protein with peptidoglycan-binding domain
MALDTLEQRAAPPPARRRSAYALVLATTALLVVVGLAVAVLVWSSPTLGPSRTALARIQLPVFAGSLVRATAFAADGTRIPLIERGGQLTPKTKLTPGESVTVDVVVKRPGWLSWALGSTHSERLTVRAPLAQISDPWVTLAAGAPLRVSFAAPPARVLSTAHFSRRSRTLTFGRPAAAAGSLELRAAARRWERLGPVQTVSWFPQSSSPVLVASPGASSQLDPTTPIRLTFSQPVAQAIGATLPRIEPHVAGSWRQSDSHTLVFTPAGIGFPLAGSLQVVLSRSVDASQPPSVSTQPTKTIAYSVAPGTTLRLQQLLAQAGYLPVDWTASAGPVAQTAQAETVAAIDPPAGSFNWRYAGTPAPLQALWRAGEPNVITKGAVMTFERRSGLAVDGIAGPKVWHTLLAAAIAGKRHTAPYSYVYVHSQVPESLTLWSAGHVVLRSPGNTGIPSRPTQPGTFTVFEHIPVGTMSGTNPDGSKYHDPGIRYISYFNGGDAIHEYPRASYGTPQSLGCVELPLAAAAKVWPYTPVGTLVTIVD